MLILVRWVVVLFPKLLFFVVLLPFALLYDIIFLAIRLPLSYFCSDGEEYDCEYFSRVCGRTYDGEIETDHGTVILYTEHQYGTVAKVCSCLKIFLTKSSNTDSLTVSVLLFCLGLDD